jgi:hypothetical protein
MTNLANRIRYSDPQDPWEMIQTPWGQLPAWKASTMATGTMGAYTEYLKHIRNDAANAEARIAFADVRADELNEREANLSARERALEDGTLKLHHMIDRAAAMLDALEQRRADQLEGPLPLPPTEEPEHLRTEEPPAGSDAVSASASADEGDLEPLQPKDPEEQDPDFEDDQEGGWETEFPQPGDPDLPEPAEFRDPAGDAAKMKD